MSRHLATVPSEPDLQCLLCGQPAQTYVDLCDRCASVVSAVAQRVAASMTGLAQAIVQLPGQLELDGDDQ